MAEYRRAVYCYETNTVYESVAEVARRFGYTKAAITLACQGKLANVGGYHLCYEKDMDDRFDNEDDWIVCRTKNKKLGCRNLTTGEELYFESRKEAGESLGIRASDISNAIHGRIKKTHGWTFWDAED